MEKKPLGIYVHIPFCAKKCGYCDFLSYPAMPKEHADYAAALEAEAASYKAIANMYRVDSVFFGGGTPSITDGGHIENVLGTLREIYEFAADVEISLEANPGTLNVLKLEHYISIGINRLSIGMQSADDAQLELLGRIHRHSDTREAVRLARKVGFKNINLDIMFGLPGQSMDSWLYTLEKAIGLCPEHISAYGLKIEGGTPFYMTYGTLPGRNGLPNEEEERRMYHKAVKILGARGLIRYEISNFAKGGRRCRHNLKYWTGGEYLGHGLGAASYFMGKRFSNPKDMGLYKQSAPNAWNNMRSLPEQSEKERVEEFMFLGLRLSDGIFIDEFEGTLGIPFEQTYGRTVRRLCELGTVKESDGRVRLTEYGVDVSNQVLSEFILDDRPLYG